MALCETFFKLTSCYEKFASYSSYPAFNKMIKFNCNSSSMITHSDIQVRVEKKVRKFNGKNLKNVDENLIKRKFSFDEIL